LIKTIKHILKNEKDLQNEVKELLEYWLENSISVKDAQAAWFKSFSTTSLYPAANLTNRDARVSFCRYSLVGVLDADSNYQRGNPTYFALPKSLSNHIH
jgi:hypothetical protein